MPKPAPGGETPLAYMIRVMNDPRARASRRDEMAKTAAHYMHSRLALLQQHAAEDAELPESLDLSRLTDDELDQLSHLRSRALVPGKDTAADPAKA